MNPSTALPGKYKDLISLAVSSQIPCRYCILSDTEFAKLDGASDAEIAEAIALGGLTREFSALLNGAQTDIGKYRYDLGRIAKSMAAVQDSRKKSTAKAK
jgi:AhpD family alkylhydroperoxidase